MMSHPQKDVSLSNVHGSVDTTRNRSWWRQAFVFFGPAYLVSVGYMDPGNWATDLAGGSRFGYSLLWVLLMSNGMAILLQNLSARLGIVRGRDLAQANREVYPAYINIPLYILAEIAIAACDLAEVLGMAIGLQLLTGLPLVYGVGITVLDTFLLLFLQRLGMRRMEAFVIGLIAVVGGSFLVEILLAKPALADIATGFIPVLHGKEALYIAISIIGATVMPHNLYLHSSLVQTRKITRTDEGIKSAIKFNVFDTVIALNIAFVINAAILILAASAFFARGYFKVAEIQDAYKLLEHIFGSLAPVLFAVALIAAGQSSTITGTLAGQIIMEGHINLRIEPWLRRLLTRILAIVPAVFTILYSGEQGLGNLIILSQVVLSLQLGFAVIPLIHFVSDKKKMGNFTIGIKIKILAWACAIIIVGLNAQLVYEQLGDWIQQSPGTAIWMYTLVIPVIIAITLLLLYVFLRPLLFKHKDQAIYIPHGLATVIDELDAIKYYHIGVTIDFSKNDTESIRHAIMQGGKHADYTLIHVVETAGARYYGNEVMDQETQSDLDNLNKYVEAMHKIGYKASPQIGYGSPASSIAKIVKDEHIDFIVMGSHGHKVIKDLIFGTTVNKVRHRVNVPVLVVKPR